MDFTSRDFDLEENVFFFFNEERDALSFVLEWDTSDKFYHKLLNRFFANVLDEPDEHSMILTKPNDTTYFHETIPAFDLQYIKHCFDLKDYPDPTEYLIKKSCPVRYTKQDIVDCWMHKKKSWSDLIPVVNNNRNGSEISSISSCYKESCIFIDSDSDESTDLIHKKLSHRTCSTAILKKNLIRDNSPDSNQDYLEKLRNNSDDEISLFSNQRYVPSSSSSTVSNFKKSRLPYTHKEDIEIVKFIVKNKYAFNITGKQMWQHMERANICKIRTWQSMKERYLKHIKFDLKSGSSKLSFLSQNELKLLRQGLRIDIIKKRDKEKLKSKFQNERVDEMCSD